MSTIRIKTEPNRDLTLTESNFPRWESPDNRRRGWHSFPDIVRYGITIRAPEVRVLEKRIDYRIGWLESVRRLTSGPAFSAIVALHNDTIIHEAYAPDFQPDRRHSMQSISKTTCNLIVGRLVEQGLIDLSATIADYLPEIGSGYATATVQQVLDMDVANDYSEDYADPDASVFVQESTHGWRLPKPAFADLTLRQFLTTISSDDLSNPTRENLYKSANTDVLGWVAERVSGRSLRDFLIEIAEAAGLEGVMFVSTDREFTPVIDGGIALTARDLARYGLLLLQNGEGIGGRVVGSKVFIEAAKSNPGTIVVDGDNRIHYSNQFETNGHWFGHAGWGGQWLHIDQDAGVVIAFFSVLENASAWDSDYWLEIVKMSDDIAKHVSSYTATHIRNAWRDAGRRPSTESYSRSCSREPSGPPSRTVMSFDEFWIGGGPFPPRSQSRRDFRHSALDFQSGAAVVTPELSIPPRFRREALRRLIACLRRARPQRRS